MRRTMLIVVLVLAGSVSATKTTQRSASEDRRVDQCLRRHDWASGEVALKRAEIQHGHPNGLLRICRATDRADSMDAIARNR